MRNRKPKGRRANVSSGSTQSRPNYGDSIDKRCSVWYNANIYSCENEVIMKGIIKSDKEPAKLSKWKIRGITALIAGVVFLFVGCGDKTPQKPVDPINPNPPIVDIDPGEDKEKEALEKAIGEYNSIVTKIENADSLTARVIGNTKTETIKIDDNKLELSDKIYETSSDKTFVYSQNQEGWQKDFSDGENTSSKMHKTINDTLKSAKWTELENKVLSGTMQIGSIAQNKTTISCEYDTQKNTLTLSIPGQTMNICDVDNTQINLPAEYTDNTQEKPPVEEFKVEELMTKLQPTLKIMKDWTAGEAAQLLEVKRLYLTKSANSQIIDTVGAVFTAKKNGEEWLYLAETKLPVIKDLTYQDICENGLTYNENNATTPPAKYSIPAARTQETANKANAEIVLNQMFGEKYTNSDWSCWKFGVGPQGDMHTIVVLSENSILEQSISINHNYNESMNSYIEKNFLGKEPSNSTYQLVKNKKVEIQKDALNVQKLLQQIKDIEQSI